MAWPKGKPRPPGAGRKKGTPNKASRPWKELVTAICEDPAHQERLLSATLERPELIFKAADYAFGKPTEHIEIGGSLRMIQWPDAEDVAE